MRTAPSCDSFHMRRRDGSSIPCARCPQPCPVCHGQGFRTTQDGTRPACGECGGRGWIKSLPTGFETPAGDLPPAPTPPMGPAVFPDCDDPEGATR